MDIFGKDISIRQSFVIEIEMDCYHKCHMCKLERYAQIAHSLNNFIQHQTTRDHLSNNRIIYIYFFTSFSCILNKLEMCKCKSCAKEKKYLHTFLYTSH